jgi:hypothetical protein
MDKLQDQYLKGLEELRNSTLKQIQIDTAYKWAGRALAAHYLGLHHDAIEYAHEAIEHGALSGVESLLREIRAAFDRVGLNP